MLYGKLCSLIKRCCKTIILEKDKHKDGRIDSSIKEDYVLKTLKKNIKQKFPEVKVIIPTHRSWYDIYIGGLYINLKLSSCCSNDNAFNKKAMLYSIHHFIPKSNSMNFKDFTTILKSREINFVRNRTKEYHYLVFNKKNGDILLKPIFDLFSYKSNPSNILQINWKREFEEIDYKCRNPDYESKVKSLLLSIQKSLNLYYNTIKTYIELDIENL